VEKEQAVAASFGLRRKLPRIRRGDTNILSDLESSSALVRDSLEKTNNLQQYHWRLSISGAIGL
jgi:hypothetical protein